MKKITLMLRLIAGIAIIAFLFYKVGIKDVLQTLTTIKPTYLIAYLLLVFVSLIIGAYKIKLLINPIKKLSFLKTLRYYLLSFAIGAFIPARAGEFILVYFLKQEDIELSKGAAITLMDKIIILLILSIISIFGFFVFFTPTRALQLTAILIAMFLLLGILLLSKRIRWVIKKYILRKYADKFSGLTETIRYYLKNQKKALLFNAASTTAKWVIAAIAVKLLFAGFAQNPNIVHILMILAIGTITTIIPITISGLGIREGVAVYLFSQIGIAAQITLTVYMIMLIINFLIAATSLILLKWQR